MRTNEVLSALQISFSTLRNWERKGLIHTERNDLGWREFNSDEILRLKKRLVKNNRSGKKLIVANRERKN